MHRPRIVVLDGFALNPGDLSWDRLRELGDCAIHDRSTPAETLERAHEAEAVLTNKAPLPREAIAQLPHLRYIGVTATGYNVVDTAAARERGIPVSNVPIYGTRSVAQMVFAHILHFAMNVAGHAAAVREGRWTRSIDWCFWDTPLLELEGLTLGVVGLGRIGEATARLAQGFGMRVIASTRSGTTELPGVACVGLEELFQQSDVVSLHCPLTPATEKLVNRERLALMKPSALLVNTGRGPLVDEVALAEALNAGRLAAAALDVLSAEPPRADNPLLAARNCCITPHIAWATQAARRRLLDTAVDNVAAFLAGRPIHVVNP